MYFVLVFETNLLCFGCLAASPAEFDLSLVQPALVCGRRLHVLWRGHRVVQLKLLHETVIGLTERPRFSHLCQGLHWRDAV